MRLAVGFATMFYAEDRDPLIRVINFIQYPVDAYA